MLPTTLWPLWVWRSISEVDSNPVLWGLFSEQLASSVRTDSEFGNALLYYSELLYMYCTKTVLRLMYKGQEGYPYWQGPNPTRGRNISWLLEGVRGRIYRRYIGRLTFTIPFTNLNHGQIIGIEDSCAARL